MVHGTLVLLGARELDGIRGLISFLFNFELIGLFRRGGMERLKFPRYSILNSKIISPIPSISLPPKQILRVDLTTKELEGIYREKISCYSI